MDVPTKRTRSTIVFFWTTWGSIMGGFAGVSGACFGLDLLPIGKDGRPANPARDQNL